MLMSRSSLDVGNWNKITNLAFATYPEAETCLENLFELRRDGDEKVEILVELSEKITSLRKITFNLRAQQNPRRNRIIKQASCRNMHKISLLARNPNNVIKFEHCGVTDVPLSFIQRLTNLKELVIAYARPRIWWQMIENSNMYLKNVAIDTISIDNLNCLRTARFPHLRVLRFPSKTPNNEIMIRSLSNHGGNLREFHLL